jgi:transcriptional regulator with XRE-family HTH domain
MPESDSKIWEAAGRRIRLARKRLGMSQEDLCWELSEKGLVEARLDVRTLRRFENEGRLRWKTIRIFARYFNVSEEILTDLELSDETVADAIRAAVKESREAKPGAQQGCPGGSPAKQLDWLSIPELQWRGGPAALLRAEYAIVPFHGRESEIGKLKSWALNEDESIIQLISGSGGMGKTRLARQLCLQLRSDGIQAGFLVPCEIRQCLSYFRLCPDVRMLLVVDYAETAEEEITQILRISANRNLGSARLLLLARGAGNWWSRLIRRCDGIGVRINQAPIQLRPLSIGIDARRISYSLAGQAFAEKLAATQPAAPPSDLMADYYDRALFLHMSALLATQEIEVQGSEAILEKALEREMDYWAKQLKDRQLPKFLEDGFWRAMGVISAYGGVRGKQEAVKVISKIRFFRDQPVAVLEAIADTLHDCYPGPPWIEAIQPDLLMEYLIGKATKDDPDAIDDTVLS